MPDLFDYEQPEHLERVSARIGRAIRDFFADLRRETFHAEDLRTFIRGQCGEVAPGSPDRVMRDLRKQGVINYVVLNRRQSHYRIVRNGGGV